MESSSWFHRLLCWETGFRDDSKNDSLFLLKPRFSDWLDSSFPTLWHRFCHAVWGVWSLYNWNTPILPTARRCPRFPCAIEQDKTARLHTSYFSISRQICPPMAPCHFSAFWLPQCLPLGKCALGWALQPCIFLCGYVVRFKKILKMFLPPSDDIVRQDQEIPVLT